MTAAAAMTKCPVCGGNDLRTVRRLATGGGAGGGTYLALRWGAISSDGRLEARICRECGHTSLFLADPSALEEHALP